MSTDPAAARLAEMKRLAACLLPLRGLHGPRKPGLMAEQVAEFVPSLVAAVERLLAEADSWAQDISGAIGPGYNATRACGRRAREIITRELTGAAPAAPPTAFTHFRPESGMDDRSAEDNGITG
jgi:hypothetical protein